MHTIQVDILKILLFKEKARYSDLRPSDDVENNQLNFHLKVLIEQELIEKVDDRYRLTAKGKEHAGRLSDAKPKEVKQAKISAWICAIRKDENEEEYLVYTRLKHPFYGCTGFITGKVEYGEQILEAAERELKEETNLSGKAVMKGCKHYRVYDHKTKDLLEDKFMFLCIVKNPIGKLIPSPEGKYEWVKKSKLKAFMTKPFESWESIESELKMAQTSGFQFVEFDAYTDRF